MNKYTLAITVLLLRGFTAEAQTYTYSGNPRARIDYWLGRVTTAADYALVCEGGLIRIGSWNLTNGVPVEADLSAPAVAEAWWNAQQPESYPTPDVTVPIVDAAGNPIGTARLLVDADGNIVVVTDSASPQRPWSVQKDDAVAKIKAANAQRAANAASAAAASTNAAAANSVPALRVEVKRLADIVAAMNK